MKTGRTLTEMAQALEAQQALKKDYVADTRVLEMTPNGQLAITNGATQTFDITTHAHRQMGDRIIYQLKNRFNEATERSPWQAKHALETHHRHDGLVRVGYRCLWSASLFLRYPVIQHGRLYPES